MTMATIRCPNCGYVGKPQRYLRWGSFLGFSVLATFLGIMAFWGVFCGMVAERYTSLIERTEGTGDPGVILLVLLLAAPVIYALIAYFTSGHRCPLCKYPYVTKR